MKMIIGIEQNFKLRHTTSQCVVVYHVLLHLISTKREAHWAIPDPPMGS
jgi:hypothetical protein